MDDRIRDEHPEILKKFSGVPLRQQERKAHAPASLLHVCLTELTMDGSPHCVQAQEVKHYVVEKGRHLSRLV